MFTCIPLKNAAGIALFSDYLSLKRAHEILHDVNERSPLIRDKEGFFLSLASDVRKAYEGQRLKQEADPMHPEAGTRLGFEILWPTLLIQCRQLRDSLAFIDHGKEHQIVAYELEFVIGQDSRPSSRRASQKLRRSGYGCRHGIPSSKKMQKHALLSLLRGTNASGETV